VSALEIPIGEAVHFDACTHVASTGAVSDADSTPTYAVYEEDSDTAVFSGNMTKRTALTGDYRGTFTADSGNVTAGKFYSVIVSATVSSVAAKAVALSFRAVAAETVAGTQDVNTTKVGNTTQTAADLGVLPTRIPGNVTITSGVVEARLADGVNHGGNDTRLILSANTTGNNAPLMLQSLSSAPAIYAASETGDGVRFLAAGTSGAGSALNMQVGNTASPAVEIVNGGSGFAFSVDIGDVSVPSVSIGGNLTAGNITTGGVVVSTYAGGDTSGTTTLLSRLSAARAGYLDNLSAGAVATAAKVLNYFRLLYRSDAAIATDAAAELTEINANLGSGAGGVVTTTDSAQAIRDRGDAAWTTGAGGTPPQLLQSTTIATLATQVSFTLTAGSADDDAYNGAVVVVTDSATSTQKAVATVSDYTGSTKTVTLAADPAVFTMATGDTIEIMAALGSGPTAVAIRTEIDANSTELANITTQIGAAGAGLTQIPTIGNVTNVTNSGNATLGNNAHQGTSLAISGNLTAGNATVSGTTALGEVTAGNATVSGTTALGAVTASSAAVSGNFTAGNVTVSGTTALGTLTAEAGNVTAMTADATKIGGNTTAATNLAASARGVVSTTVDDASASTTSFVTALTEATDDHYNGRVIVFLDGALAGQATDITDYTGATKTVTVTALTEAPANGSAFVIV